MNIANIKLTQNQQLIVNALLSMLGSAFIGAAQAAYQYVTQQGTINIVQVLTIFTGALWILLSTAFISYVPSHIQQELEALRELQTPVQAPAQPLVVIHTTGASIGDAVQKPASSVPSVAIPPRPAPKPVQLQTVTIEPAQQTAQQLQQVWLSATVHGSSGTQQAQAPTDDVLGDLPVSNGQPVDVKQITGVVPTYGASSK